MQGILWFDEIDLYEDDLHDNGVAKLFIKVRVMPSCFFVLHRFWLRVDNNFARVYDTRCYHRFGESSVLFETRFSESTYEDMRSRGFTVDDKRLPNADIASLMLNTIKHETNTIFF